jgi:hypothetical protein
MLAPSHGGPGDRGQSQAKDEAVLEGSHAQGETRRRR